MSYLMKYGLIPVRSMLLITAQAIWGTAIRGSHLLQGSVVQVATNLLTSPRIWVGGLLYALAVVVYFYLLSVNKFFAVQIPVTAIGIIFSLALSAILFHDHITPINLVGVAVVLGGIVLVLTR